MSNFDKSQLTATHRVLLAQFRHRRRAFDGFLETSNVIHHKHACPACGMPAVDDGSSWAVCVVCLWEDCGFDDKAETIEGPPNYMSLIASRIDVSAHLEALLRTHVIGCSMDEIVRCIKRFEQRLRDGDAALDTKNFAANLCAILPLRPRAERASIP